MILLLSLSILVFSVVGYLLVVRGAWRFFAAVLILLASGFLYFSRMPIEATLLYAFLAYLVCLPGGAGVLGGGIFGLAMSRWRMRTSGA